MAEGDITASMVFSGFLSGTQCLGSIDAFTTGGSVAARDINTFQFVPAGDGQVTIYKLARSAT